MKYEGWPELGELVVGKVDEIEDFGVFVDLEEYRDKRGLVHISEVAAGWIKNVRDHVREGQTVVAKVLDVDRSSQQIDLSIKDVNDHQRSETIQEWKNEALRAAGGNGAVPAEADLEVTYVGAPEYRIRVEAPNYKTAEDELEAAAARATNDLESRGGTGAFHRERQLDDE